MHRVGGPPVGAVTAPRGFRWRGFLQFAERCQGWPGQLMRRTVINRAYYAAFHSARHALRDHGLDEAQTRFHRQVWQQYLTADEAPPTSVSAWRGIADLGMWLHEERLRADYDGHSSWARQQCREVVRRARMLVSLVDALPAAPSR